MNTCCIGSRFPVKDPWGRQDDYIIRTVVSQIEKEFSQERNLVIITTWFGSQFSSDSWSKVQSLIRQGEIFDNLFWLAPVDPICILEEDFTQIQKGLHIKQSYQIGTGFNGRYEFNTGAIACYEEFPDYSTAELKPTKFDFVYLCYNRKPKPHRINLVNQLFARDLQHYGAITLGEPALGYDVTEGADYHGPIKILDRPEDYTRDGFYNLHTDFGGVPYDLTSLGKIDIWQRHFLNIVSETEFREWTNRFVTEKTWKPIIGLRPFVINGQVKIYKWLRDNGFKTFNHYFPVDLENSYDDRVQIAIVDVVKYLITLSQEQIQHLYTSMLPDLLHNHERFFVFAEEQKYKLDHLFS